MNQYPHCACHLSFSFPALPSPSLSLLALLSAWPSLSLSSSSDSPHPVLALLHVFSSPPFSRRSFSTFVSTFLLSLFTAHPIPRICLPLARVALYFLSRTRYHVSVSSTFSLHPRFLLTVFGFVSFFFGLSVLFSYSRIIGPSSFSSNLSFFSRFFLFRFFLSPFTFNLLCIIVFGLSLFSLPFFRLLGFSFPPFISRALYSLFRMSFLPFVYSFFVILFDFSSVFLSTNPSRISLSTCSKKVDARGNMDEKRESNEHGVEFGIECITRVTPISKGCSSDLRSFEKMDRNTK